MKRLTVLLPDDLHERLLWRALARGISLSSLIREQLAEETDPLLQVAGICSDGTLTTDIDKDLYEI